MDLSVPKEGADDEDGWRMDRETIREPSFIMKLDGESSRSCKSVFDTRMHELCMSWPRVSRSLFPLEVSTSGERIPCRNITAKWSGVHRHSKKKDQAMCREVQRYFHFDPSSERPPCVGHRMRRHKSYRPFRKQSAAKFLTRSSRGCELKQKTAKRGSDQTPNSHTLTEEENQDAGHHRKSECRCRTHRRGIRWFQMRKSSARAELGKTRERESARNFGRSCVRLLQVSSR